MSRGAVAALAAKLAELHHELYFDPEVTDVGALQRLVATLAELTAALASAILEESNQ